MTARRMAATLIAGGMALALAGCSGTPQYKQDRLENLNAHVAEFDVASRGEVLCDFSGGEVSLGNGWTHTFLMEGTDSLQPLIDRFEELDYKGNAAGDSGSFYRGTVIGYLQLDASTGVEEAAQDHLEENGCDEPLEGNLYLVFSEQGLEPSE